MSHVIEPRYPWPMRRPHLFGVALHIVILLCWAGIVPAWRLLPAPAQPVVLPMLNQLYWPALYLAGATLLVALLRFADLLDGGFDRMAGLALQLGGLAFTLIVFKAISGLPLAGLGLDWQWTVIMAMLHVGATVGLLFLPWLAAIILIVGVLGLLRGDWRTA